MPKYLRRPEEKQDPYASQPLPVDRPVAVYYRQSTEGQVGNISTTLQTVDMVEHLVRLGWVSEQVLMIDMDAGVSGTKKIQDRPGMSRVMRLIETQAVGAVAAQDVDRFFRDVTQIETNIFIDACRRNNVLVLTPTMIFDFRHPMQGRYHMQMFRDHAQRAADYLEYHIQGRLQKSKQWMQERGMWCGRRIAPGYMVDMREKVDGVSNPNYRKYVPFPIYADVIKAYFEIFRSHNGVQTDTIHHIFEHGPFYPEFSEEMVPEGFYYYNRNTTRSPITGKLCPAYSGLACLLTNVVYLGHWTNSGAIVQWDNHEPLVSAELFMYAFNRISTKDFFGEPNPDYMPHRPYNPVPKSERTKPMPTYAGFLFSDDLEDLPHRRLSVRWATHQQYYFYMLYEQDYKRTGWEIKSEDVDAVIDQMLVERIQTTTLDERLWQNALETVNHGGHEEIQRIEREIQTEKRSQDNIIASLGTLTNETMVRRAEAQFEAAERRVQMLEEQIEDLRSQRQRQRHLIQARPALERLVQNWERIPTEEKRNIFQDFAYEAQLTAVSSSRQRIMILWRDGSKSVEIIQRRTRFGRRFWDEYQHQRLVEMIEANCDQVDILRAFPDYSWNNLQKRYIRFKRVRYWPRDYAGHRPYKKETRWEDTKEYQLEQQGQNPKDVDRRLPSRRYWFWHQTRAVESCWDRNPQSGCPNP